MAFTQMLHDYGESVERETMTVLASDTRSAGDVVYWTLGENGPVDVTITSTAAVNMIGVWAQDCASGDRGLIVIKGPVTATVTSGSFTAGNGIEVDGANIEDSGGSFSGCVGESSTDFAVALEDGTTVTELDICLAGGPFTSTN